MRRCRLIGISHAKVDNVFSSLAGFQLQRLNLRKHVGRKSLDPIKSVAQTHGVPCIGWYFQLLPKEDQRKKRLF